MKKVWILEKFASVEEQAKSYENLKAMIEFAKTPEEVAAVEAHIASYKKVMDENPDGRWYGFEGKVIYRQFCDVAKDALRRWPEGTFRVVEAEIEDDAKSWIGYKMIKVNEGVLRYLMATK